MNKRAARGIYDIRKPDPESEPVRQNRMKSSRLLVLILPILIRIKLDPLPIQPRRAGEKRTHGETDISTGNDGNRESLPGTVPIEYKSETDRKVKQNR